MLCIYLSDRIHSIVSSLWYITNTSTVQMCGGCVPRLFMECSSLQILVINGRQTNQFHLAVEVSPVQRIGATEVRGPVHFFLVSFLGWCFKEIGLTLFCLCEIMAIQVLPWSFLTLLAFYFCRHFPLFHWSLLDDTPYRVIDLFLWLGSVFYGASRTICVHYCLTVFVFFCNPLSHFQLIKKL